jgi:signal transduction histidine kinase
VSRTTRLWVLVVPAALVVGAAATSVILASDHMQVPRVQALFAALTGGSFIAAGLVARTRRPENLTGLLLIAVGFTWFVSVGLMGANDPLVWTVGLSLSALPAAFLIHLLIAYPTGRLQSRWDQSLVVAGYVLVTVAHLAMVVFDPDPLRCRDDGCPTNEFLINDSETWRDVANLSITLVAVAYLGAVVATLVGRWKHSSTAARRVLTPVLLAGAASLFLFALSVGTRSFAETFAKATEWMASTAIIFVPFLLLTGLLKSRLARGDITRVLAEEPVGGVQERVRELLRDPTAELLHACSDPSMGFVDNDGRPRAPVAAPGRAVTFVERGGRRLGALVHDEALLNEPELLEQVAAAVGLEIERDNNLWALQASERRSRALLEALPDKIFRLTEDGIVLDIQEQLDTSSPTTAEVGRSIYDSHAPRELIERLLIVGRRAVRTGELQTIEWEWGQPGDLLYAEGRFIPSGNKEFLMVVRDVSARKRQEVEQAALHRVALAVASEARTDEIFNLVAEEVARVLDAHTTNLVRYDDDGGESGVVVGGWRKPGARGVAMGERQSLKGTASQAVARTGQPVRREATDPEVSPQLRELMRDLEIHSLIAAPIKLANRPWGAVVATLTSPYSFASGTEERLEAFSRLIALALANEEARGQLAASRARIVTASDEERRRLERNLHDGAQQRLVSVSVSLRLAQTWLERDGDGAADGDVRELLSDANVELGLALEELRELARGIHPAVLTERGLGPALTSLANRSTIPVEVEGLPRERLPEKVEAAAYYVVSEALANVAKHADASTVTVRVGRDNGNAVVEVIDDGRGGANPGLGTGLHGLADRVESLDGYLRVESPLGAGTTVRAEIPCQ